MRLKTAGQAIMLKRTNTGVLAVAAAPARVNGSPMTIFTTIVTIMVSYRWNPLIILTRVCPQGTEVRGNWCHPCFMDVKQDRIPTSLGSVRASGFCHMLGGGTHCCSRVAVLDATAHAHVRFGVVGTALERCLARHCDVE